MITFAAHIRCANYLFRNKSNMIDGRTLQSNKKVRRTQVSLACQKSIVEYFFVGVSVALIQIHICLDALAKSELNEIIWTSIIINILRVITSNHDVEQIFDFGDARLAYTVLHWLIRPILHTELTQTPSTHGTLFHSRFGELPVFGDAKMLKNGNDIKNKMKTVSM